MNVLDSLHIRLALQDLNNEFGYLLDHNDIDRLVDLFTDDAVYTHGIRRSKGRAEIRAVFESRTAAGPRTSRHLATGLILQIESESAARGSSVCLTFAVDGIPPITPATPFLVADFVDQYRLCADGRWRFLAREIHRVFAAEGNSGPAGGKR